MRIRLLGITIFVSFILLILGLFYIQIIKGPLYQRLSTQNRIRLVAIESPRGRIFDRNGLLLVDNRISFDAVIIPQELKDKEETLKGLSKRLNVSKERLKSSLESNFKTPFSPVKIISDIGKKNAIILEEERLELPGVIIETRPRRHYLYGEIGSHIFGYLGQINSSEFTKLKSYGYKMDDIIGRAGIEKSYNNYLKGIHGGLQIEVDNRGRQVEIMGIREPIKGKDIYLTIDIRLQKFIEGLFQGAQGVICVMDPKDGQVLSLVSSPSFDPNIFVNDKDHAAVKEIFKRDNYPMLNRAIHCQYPPGSVFKVIPAIAALETGKVSTKTTISCSGNYSLGNKVFRCWRNKGHGTQNIREAIKNSCNTFFYHLGRVVGADDIASYAVRLGFGRPSGIDLPDEAGGLVPNRMWKVLTKRRPWYEGETLNYAIGQGYLLVTPMQILRMIVAIASDGHLVRPYLVKRIEDVDISQKDSRPLKISQDTLNIIKDGLIKVVNDPDGTGRKAAAEGLLIAGKTGTAQTFTGRTHAWFAGFAPVDDPKAALVVFLEYGGKGGLAASQTAGLIFQELKNLGYL